MSNLFLVALLGSAPALIIRFIIFRKPFNGVSSILISLVIGFIFYAILQIMGMAENFTKVATGIIAAWSFSVLHYFNFDDDKNQDGTKED